MVVWFHGASVSWAGYFARAAAVDASAGFASCTAEFDMALSGISFFAGDLRRGERLFLLGTHRHRGVRGDGTGTTPAHRDHRASRGTCDLRSIDGAGAARTLHNGCVYRNGYGTPGGGMRGAHGAEAGRVHLW